LDVSTVALGFAVVSCSVSIEASVWIALGGADTLLG
jgi:hypothetical protein